MRNKLLLLLPFFIISTISAQINPKDSTAQAVGYWSKLDTQKYKVHYNKYNIKETDTIIESKIDYDVDIKIIDSTSNSYTIDWFYHNYQITSNNEIVNKLSKVANDITVQFETDEYGAFKEVKNWKDISKYIKKTLKPLKKEFKDTPGIDKIFTNVENLYNSKQSIEANAIKDIIQFYSFHGAQYKLYEKLKGKTTVSNNFGGEPFTTNFEISLDEIDTENDNYIVRMKNSIDPDQLTSETYKYLNKMGVISLEQLNSDKLPKLSNITYSVSRIHGNTGWIIYSLESKEVESNGVLKIEERIIEIL